jgi:glucuronate isomerase
MRSCGVPEAYITGDKPDEERFQKWAECLGKAVGNPLYHWSHLELRRYFGYEGILNGRTWKEVWELCNKTLERPEMGVRGLIRQSGVTLICTTDDPADTLEWHEKLAADDSFEVQVLPAWRPDKAMNLEKPDYLDYSARLSAAADTPIRSFRDLKAALKIRLAYFARHGCQVSDHALEYVMYAPASEEEVEAIFARRLAGETVTYADQLRFKTAFMGFVAQEYAQMGWVMQLHYGCKRDNNARRYAELGPDTGYDCINNYAPSSEMADFLNSLEENGALPKTILYSLNPNDNQAIGTILGCFQDSTAVAKLQQGSAWWFNDHKTGMRDQLISLANLGNLSGFVGMLTDSRSFLSYTRHEYFRRILCGLLGEWVENGEYPDDDQTLGEIIKDICYNNAVRYFGFDLECR